VSLWSWTKKCAEGAADEAAIGAAAGGVVGGTAGGVYGCLANTGDLQRAGDELEAWWGRQQRTLERMADHAVDDVLDWITGRPRKRARKRPTPPTMEGAIALILDHLTKRGGSPNGVEPWRFEVRAGRGWRDMAAGWPLHPSVRQELYGDAAAGWDAEELYRDIATMWHRTPERWGAGARLTVAMRRVGDARAAGVTVAEGWPVFPAEEGGARARLAQEMEGGEQQLAVHADESWMTRARQLAARVFGWFGRTP
jgi:hypothetical protein